MPRSLKITWLKLAQTRPADESVKAIDQLLLSGLFNLVLQQINYLQQIIGK